MRSCKVLDRPSKTRSAYEAFASQQPFAPQWLNFTHLNVWVLIGLMHHFAWYPCHCTMEDRQGAALGLAQGQAVIACIPGRGMIGKYGPSFKQWEKCMQRLFQKESLAQKYTHSQTAFDGSAVKKRGDLTSVCWRKSCHERSMHAVRSQLIHNKHCSQQGNKKTREPLKAVLDPKPQHTHVACAAFYTYNTAS